jgi:ribosomal-protein-alanine N-acetyltransferase
VYLRPVAPGDRAAWCELRDASLEHLLPWEPQPAPGRAGGSSARFDRLLRQRDDPTSRRYLLCRRRDEALLGMISLNQIVMGPFRNAVLGYWLGALHTGRGYMTEGLTIAVRHAFHDLELHRVEANVRPENAASLAVMRRLGFREEGFSPRYLEIAGAWADHVRFALTAEDQRPQRGAGA